MFLIWVLPPSSVVASMQKGAGISVLSWICKSGELNPFAVRAWHLMSQPANKAHPVSWPALQASGVWMPELNLISSRWRKAESLGQKATPLMPCSQLAVPLPVPNIGMTGKLCIRLAEIFCFPVNFSAAGGWVSGLGFFIDLPHYCDGWHRHVKCVEGQIFLPPRPIKTSPGMAWQNYQRD